jgi:hypothetical protein
MIYQVSDRIKKQSSKCPYIFKCLKNETWDTCSIGKDIQGAFLVIKTKKTKNNCPYCFSYGNKYYCNCPTRGDIYKRYNI